MRGLRAGGGGVARAEADEYAALEYEANGAILVRSSPALVFLKIESWEIDT